MRTVRRDDDPKTARIKRREFALALAIIAVIALALIAETDAQGRRASAPAWHHVARDA